jgi:hypothetical protein
MSDVVAGLVDREYAFGFHTAVDTELAPKASVRTSSASSRPRTTSRNGCWSGAWAPCATSSRRRSRPGRTCTIHRSTTRRCTTQGAAGRGRRHLLLVLRGVARARRPRPLLSRVGRAGAGQFLRQPQLGGVLRRLILLRAPRGPVPDGAVDLLRINARTGQLERTLIVAEEGASVSYLEGCTAPKRDEHQLHAAWSSSWPRTTPPSGTSRCRTGTRVTPTARVASTTS